MAARQVAKLQGVVLSTFSCSATTAAPAAAAAAPTGLSAARSFSPFLRLAVISSSGPHACTQHGTPNGPTRGFHSLLASLELPTRRGHFAELPLVSEMLPNRKLMAAQFSPHGLTLVPKAILGTANAPAAAAPASPAQAAAAAGPAVQEPTNPTLQAPMQAIGIKTWRRLKMKKHKINKRRKASRMQVKKTK